MRISTSNKLADQFVAGAPLGVGTRAGTGEDDGEGGDGEDGDEGVEEGAEGLDGVEEGGPIGTPDGVQE